MIRGVAFLLQQSLTARNHERLGLDLLRANGFGVEVFDFSALIFPGTVQPLPVDDPSLTVVNDWKSARAVIARLADSSVFTIALIGLSPTSAGVFRELSRRRIRYAVASLGALPGYETVRSMTKRLTWRLRGREGMSISDIATRVRFAITATAVQPATTRLLAGSESEHSLGSPADKRDTIWVHAADFDRYLEVRRTPPPPTRSIAVFLDQLLPNHPDSLANPPVTKEKYYPSLESYFTNIERATGLRVVVAAHPKTENRAAVFGDRDLVVGKTIDLVRQATLVLAHHSTAINFAVLFNKPILFLNTNQLASTKWSAYLNGYAERLGTTVCNIDSGLRQFVMPQPNPLNYSRFIHAFITTRPDDKRCTWQIVADELKTRNIPK